MNEPKIREQVCPAKIPTLTLIELPNYRSPKLRKHFSQRDPKHALRLGMAHVGRVTQFITSDIKKIFVNNVNQQCGMDYVNLGTFLAPLGLPCRTWTSLIL